MWIKNYRMQLVYIRESNFTCSQWYGLYGETNAISLSPVLPSRTLDGTYCDKLPQIPDDVAFHPGLFSLCNFPAKRVAAFPRESHDVTLDSRPENEMISKWSRLRTKQNRYVNPILQMRIVFNVAVQPFLVQVKWEWPFHSFIHSWFWESARSAPLTF